jgi:ATP-dependent helicase/nuclease subunit B
MDPTSLSPIEPTAQPTADLDFMGWTSPALHLAADRLVAAGSQGAGGSPVDLSRHLVALPGARAGRRLLELLLDRAQDQGRALRPPRVTTVGGLPELLAPPRRTLPPPLLERRLWAEVLRGIPASDLRLLVDEPPERSELKGWMGLAGTVMELERNVEAGDHDFASVARVCRDGVAFDDHRRWQLLARVQREVWNRLEDEGFRSRSVHRRRVAAGEEGASVEAGFQGDLWLVGVVEMPWIVRRVLAALGSRLQLRALVHAPPELADAFDGLGLVRPEVWAGMHAGLPDAAIRVAGGPRDQAELLVREVERAVEDADQLSAEDVTVGVPDPELVPFVQDKLAARGTASRQATGRPVERTLAFRLLDVVSDHLSHGDWDSLAGLLRHPDLKAMLDEALPSGQTPSAVADAYHARHLPRVVVGGDLPRAGSRGSGPRLMERLRDRLGERLIQPMGDHPRDRRPLSRWPASIARVLEGVYGGRELDPTRLGDRDTLEVVRGVAEALEGLAALPPELDEEVDGATALRLVLDELRGGMVPEPAEEEAVELLGWLELHLDDAPVLVVTGVNEPHLPESVTGDPFLPHGLRRRLRLLDNDTRWARDLYRLRAMAAARPDLVLVTGRRNGAGDPLRPSRLLLAEAPPVMARRLRGFLGEGEESAGSGVEGSGADARPDEAVTDPFALPPQPELSDLAPRDSLSVTGFRSLMRDPYAFALERILELEAVDDQARELDPLGFGVLAHRILQLFGESDARTSTDETELRRTLDHFLDREAEARFGVGVLPAVRVQVEQLRARLHAFAAWQAEWVEAGWRIAGVEVSPGGEGYRFEVDGRPFHLRGRIDRVDHHPASGRWVLFDYKTSARGEDPEKTHRKKAGRGRDAPMEWVDLQLPLYRHLIRGVRRADGEPLIPADELGRVELGYILLPDDVEEVGEAIATQWGEADLLEADETARDLIRFLRRNRFEWDPEATTIRAGDGLARVVGAGVYRDLDDEDEEDSDG